MNTNKQLSRCFVCLLACLIACCLHTGCTKSGEAKTRAAQEAAFLGNLGFSPPASLTEIKYTDFYQRGVMDGGYEQWLRCTFQADVFDQMVKKKGYQKAGTSAPISGPKKPAWWPQADTGGNVTYVREGNDGASYAEHLWHDENTGFVYWHKVWWD
jgi:hypothetical protein